MGSRQGQEEAGPSPGWGGGVECPARDLLALWLHHHFQGGHLSTHPGPSQRTSSQLSRSSKKPVGCTGQR